MKSSIRKLCFCLLLFAYLTEAYPDFCAFNRANEVVDEKKCIFGWDVDPCGIKVCAKGMYFLLLYKVFSRSKKKFQIHEKTFLVQVRVRSAVENIKGTEYAAKVSCVPIAIVVRDAR